jgi:hypothetical protein
MLQGIERVFDLIARPSGREGRRWHLLELVLEQHVKEAHRMSPPPDTQSAGL